MLIRRTLVFCRSLSLEAGMEKKNHPCFQLLSFYFEVNRRLIWKHSVNEKAKNTPPYSDLPSWCLSWQQQLQSICKWMHHNAFGRISVINHMGVVGGKASVPPSVLIVLTCWKCKGPISDLTVAVKLLEKHAGNRGYVYKQGKEHDKLPHPASSSNPDTQSIQWTSPSASAPQALRCFRFGGLERASEHAGFSAGTTVT